MQHVSFLKGLVPCVQKSVRRCKSKEAAKLAYALLELSPADALRRAAVMSLEDSCLHPLLPAIVWLMMAQSKGYKLNFDHKALVVRFFHDLASSHVRETGDFENLASSSQQHATQAPSTITGGCGGYEGVGQEGRLLKSEFCCVHFLLPLAVWAVPHRYEFG